MPQDLAQHPDIQRLAAENDLLRDQLVRLLAEIDDVVAIERPFVLALYQDEQAIEPLLSPGALLVLRREPANPKDPLAVMILDESGNHLGYVPRNKNEALARLLDAGKVLFGRLESKQWLGRWLRAEVRLFLRDG